MRKIYISTVLFTIAILFSVQLNAQSNNLVPVDTGTYLHEDFEGDISDWELTGGFEVGVPTSGPGTVVSGTNCAATNLSGNYGNSGFYTMVSPEFAIPGAASTVDLTFQEYYSLESCCDYIYVEISIDGGGSWTTLVTGRNGIGGGYFENSVSLNPYIGQTATLRFRMTTDASVTYPGWYIDDVNVIGDSKMPIKGVPYLSFITEDGTIMDDTISVAENFSTLEPWIGEALIANLSNGDTLIIDSIHTTSLQLQVSTLLADSIPSAYGTPITLTYQPGAEGPVSDTLFIFSNDTTSPLVMIFEGEAYAAPINPHPELSFKGEILTPGNFQDPILIADSIQENLWDATQIDFDFILTNTGATTLDIDDIGWKYSNNHSFGIESFPSYHLEYGDTITVTLSWYAYAARRQVAAFYYDYQLRDGTLLREDFWLSAKNSYSGTVLEADGNWSSTGDSLYYNFDSIPVGDSYFMSGFSLRNYGSVPLDISIQVVGSDFEFVGETNYTLKPGQMNDEWSHEGVRFTPSDSVGIKEGLLIITHNDTTEGAIDTVYLFGKGYVEEVPVMKDPAELTFYFEGTPIEAGSTLDIDLGTAIEYNDFKIKWFEVVNSGGKTGYVGMNLLGSYWDWTTKDGTTYDSYGNMAVKPGDTLVFGVRFDPGSSNRFQTSTNVELKGDNTDWIYLNLSGKGLERWSFLVEAFGYNDVYEYQEYELYNNDGFKDTTNFVYTNLHESSVTIDSILFESGDGGFTSSTIEGLPVTLQPGEEYEFFTHFDPDFAGDQELATIKIYSDNLQEPIYIFYLQNYGNGYGSFDLELLNDTVIEQGNSLINFNEVSTIDGSRTAHMRLVPTNGYGVVIDSSMIIASNEYFTGTNLPASKVIPNNSTYDFDLSFSPMGAEGEFYNGNVNFKYTQHDLPYSSNTSTKTYNMYGYTKSNYPDKGELIVKAGNTTISNNGTLNLGNAHVKNGIEDIMITIANTGVEPIVIDTVTFSNPAFSMLVGDGMYDYGYGWNVDYYGEQTVIYFNPDIAELVEGTMTLHVVYPTEYDFVINLQGMGISSVDELELSDASVYPNPARNVAYINTGLDTETQANIFNVNGQLVFSDMVTNGQSIDISNFEPGIYMIQLQTENGQSTLKLVVE